MRLIYTTPPLSAAPTALHTGMDLSRYYSLHWMGLSFPLAAGLLVFGWRAAGVLAAMLACTRVAAAIWRRIGRRGSQIHHSHLFYLTAVLAAGLPAQLLTWRLPWQLSSPGIALLIPAAALLLVMVCWVFGGTGSNRVHPAALILLLLTLLFPHLLLPRTILQPRQLFFGDVLDVGPAAGLVWGQPWTDLPGNEDHAAIYASPVGPQLLGYTRGIERPAMSSLSLGDLLRDQLVPLEDLVVAGQPAPIGLASAIFVIVGGLVLMYNSVIDYRIPLLVVAAAYAGFILLPVPISIHTNSIIWRWLAMREGSVGWEMGLTFANYELLAGPLLFVAFFMATWPACRPMYRRGRAIYAITLGLMAAAAQLYLDVGYGAYLALVLASLLTPALDRWMRPRALV